MCRALLVAAISLAAGAVAGCGGPSGACDPQALAGALGDAVPGDVVEVGRCTVTGSFTVPAGVTLAGRGPEASVLRAPDGGRAVELIPGEAPARLVDLTVESAGCAAVVARGEGGSVVLEDLRVRVTRGIGIGVEGVASLAVTDVEVTGAVVDRVPGALPLPPYSCATADPATHGLVVLGVDSAVLSEAHVRGFAAFGALFVDSTVEWRGGGAEDNVGAGLEVWGGSADLEGLTLCRSRQDTLPIEAYNGVFGAGAAVTSRGLTVCDGANYGLLHDGSDGSHLDLVSRNNLLAGVWAQNGSSLELDGAATLLEGNGFAGVAVVDGTATRIEDATIRDTQLGTQLVGQTGSTRAADGVHLVGSPATLRALTLNDNARAGLLIDLDGSSTEQVTIEQVRIDGSGEQLGAVAQNGTLEPAWDDGVTRLGTTASNDAALSEELDIAGAIGPLCIPAPEEIADRGLDDLLGS